MCRVVAREDVSSGTEIGFAERIERRFDRLEELVEVAVILLDVQQPRNHLAGGVALLQIGHRLDPVVRVVVGRQFVQA